MSAVMRFAVPMLAVAGSAYAQCKASKAITIQNAGDATAIASCKTYSGDIAIQTDFPGPVELNGVQKIDGSLFIEDNNKVVQVSADSLEEITKSFELRNCSSVSALSFPKLKKVDTLNLEGLPILNNLGMTAEVSEARFVLIDNTQLNSLEGINLETVDRMVIRNNPFIDSIDMQLGNVSDVLEVSGNSPDVKVAFTNMIWANNITLINCSSIDLASLQSLNDSLLLRGNAIESFKAPNLTRVDGALALSDNTELTNVSFPQLVTVGQNLEVANNTKLREINGFPKLKTISGALDFNGNMSKIELPSLGDVKGAFNIQSTGDVQGTCDDVFTPLADKNKIKGEFTCYGSVENPGGEGSTPVVTGSNPKKTGAASAVGVSGSALLAGLAAIFFL